jgi:hypothetical protein
MIKKVINNPKKLLTIQKSYQQSKKVINNPKKLLTIIFSDQQLY